MHMRTRNVKLLIIQDPDTPAGCQTSVCIERISSISTSLRSQRDNLHVDLQIDKRNRMVYKLSDFNGFPGLTTHGPARTKPATRKSPSCDIVFVVRCCRWPPCASEWLTRRRRYNWQPTDVIEHFRTLSYFFVCVCVILAALRLTKNGEYHFHYKKGN